MRNAFAAELTEVAAADPRVVLLSGDIGNHLFDAYKARFPDRFLNCGAAEANMTSVAAGMALSGLRPVTYTIASFNTARCFEQIKVDLAYPGLPVVLVGVGAGLSYAELGATHEACEDLALLRALPNLTILCPSDPVEVRRALRAALAWDGPVYLRLGKKGEPAVEGRPERFEIGRAGVLRPGAEACLLATGTIVPAALEAARLLETEGIGVEVASFPTVKPLDVKFLEAVFERFGVVATVEEHGLVGGFGAAVAEWAADRGPTGSRLLRLGVRDEYLYEAGGQRHARRHFGLDPEGIAQRLRSAVREWGFAA